MEIEGTSLKARAIVFALSVGAVSFILCLIPNLGRLHDIDVIWQAVIPAVVVAAMCWATAERAISVTAEAVDAAILRMARAARGDLDSAIPSQVTECVPDLSAAMADLFAQLNANITSIERMALYDTVTGLPNRNHFRAQVDQALGTLPPDGQSALLFIDLDRFKAVNDRLGHAAGDTLLSQVSDRLRWVAEELSASGIPAPLIGRLAGDEFTVFLPHLAGLEDADRAAAAALAVLSEPFDIAGSEVEIGASIGVALRPSHGRDLSELMKAADVAMYFAKESGRGRVERFGIALADQLNARAMLDRDLRQAVTHGQFELMYQPQVAASDSRIVGAEALLRWRHPTEGLKPAVQFIKRAEETGLIVEIGDWVVDTVAATLSRWAAAGVEQRLSINLSARQIDHVAFFRRLRSAMLAAGSPARLLELELSETLAMSCSDEAIAALAALRADGATVAMDGFGTGYSNVARLRALPLDRIKLDGSVVAPVATEANARTVVHALIGLIHGLGCEVVAEGVEHPAQAEVLRVMGCDVLQGYAIAAPMAEHEFLGWTRTQAGSAATAQTSARPSTAA